MKKVLITGGGGYTGSHIVRAFENAEYEVDVLDNFNNGHKDALKGRKLIIGDLLDAPFLKNLFENNKYDGVVHCGGLSESEDSMENPEKFFQNNVVGTLNLLRFARTYGVHRLVYSSSSAVYGEPRNIPIKEDDIKVPINYFGRSKLMVEQMLIAYNTAYRLKSVSLRYFNICGADPSGEIGEDHDPETHLIPKAIEASLGRRNVIKIYGTNYPTPDGTCVRDYVDVNDLAKANVLAMQYLEDNGPTTALNLGSGKGKSVTQVLKAVKEVTHSDFKIEKVSKKLGEAATLISSNQRAKSLLGWEPKYTLEQSIVNAYNWHKNHPKGYEK